MARIWQGGAELQSAAVGVEFTAIQTTAPDVETTTKRSGNAAWRINNTANPEGFRVAHSSGQGLYYFRAYLLVVSFPTSSQQIIGGARITGAAKISFRLTSGKALQFWNTEDNAQIGSDSSALVTGTWYRLEMAYDSTTLASTLTSARAYEDTPGNTTPFWNPSGTIDLANTPVAFGMYTVAGDSTLDYIVDDLGINDSTGGVQNSWLGEGEIIHLKPDGAGDNTQWTRGGTDSGANWSQVDETTPNDATDYVESNTSGQIDDYTLEATPSTLESTDVINVVMVGARVAASDATGADPDYVLRVKASSGGTVEESGTLDVNSVTWGSPALPGTAAVPYTYALILYDLPGSSTGTWTKSELDTAQIGIRESATDTHFLRVSTIWMSVDHKPGAGGDSTPVSGSDTLSLNLTEAATVIIVVSPSDTLALSLTEVSSVVTSVSPSDTLALSLTESASVVVSVNPSDTLDLTLTDGATVVVAVSVVDTLSLSVTDTAAVEVSAAYSVSDSIDLSLFETSSVAVSVSTADTLSLSITEAGASSVAVNPSDTTDLGITETSSVVVSINPSDVLSLSLTESSAVVISNAISASDTLSLSLTETSAIVVSIAISDSLDISLTETSTSSLSVNPNDTLGLGISDTASVVVSVNPADSFSISLSESASITLSNSVSVSDTLSISLTETADLQVSNAVSVSDTLGLSLSETSQVAVSISTSDTVSISFSEAATSSGQGNPSDTTGISLGETSAVAVSLSVSDTLSISITETSSLVITTDSVPISGSDTVTITIAESSSLVFITPPVSLSVAGNLEIFDMSKTVVGITDSPVFVLSIDDSRLYNITVGDS